MQDKSGFFGLIIASALCVCAVILGAVYISGETDALSTHEQSVSEYIIDTPSDSSQKDSSSSAAPVLNSSAMLGKITESFISPYKSNTSYNRVYINNKAGVPLDIKKLLTSENPVNIEKSDEPQVLIVHTHATECYLSESRDYYTTDDLSRTTDNTKNMVAIGNIIENKLNAAGIKTLHDKTAHDYPAYSGSYSRSKKTIEKYLAEYPSIKVVIDLHRDSIGNAGGNKTKPIVEINGKKTAQVMLVMGCGANITGHENWQKNMIFAVKYQQTMEVLYPGLARGICFVNSKYNQNLSFGSILLEVGTDSNSFEEASLAADLAGDALVSYLNTLKK